MQCKIASKLFPVCAAHARDARQSAGTRGAPHNGVVRHVTHVEVLRSVDFRSADGPQFHENGSENGCTILTRATFHDDPEIMSSLQAICKLLALIDLNQLSRSVQNTFD